MKNTMEDLNNHLFAQIERLGDEDLKGQELLEEMGRSQAISEVARQIVANGNLVFSVWKHKQGAVGIEDGMPKMLDGK